jgi:hypothetical protein
MMGHLKGCVCFCSGPGGERTAGLNVIKIRESVKKTSRNEHGTTIVLSQQVDMADIHPVSLGNAPGCIRYISYYTIC